MGISLQCYRVTVGLFSIPAMKRKSSFKSSKYCRGAFAPKYISVLSCTLILIHATLSLCNLADFNLSIAKLSSVGDSHAGFHSNRLRKIDHNFKARYTFGNRHKTGLRLGHINMGGGYLCNKVNELERIVSQEKPHVLGISEAQFKKSHDLDDLKIDRYSINFSDTLYNQEINVSRVAVLVHDDVVVNIRRDLMNNEFSSIWLEIGFRNQKKFLLSNAYREWQYLGQTDQSSRSRTAQMHRFQMYINQWLTAIRENKEIICLGDMNINFMNWTNPSQPNDFDEFSSLLLEKIVPHGFIQLVTQPTRFWPGLEPSGLDHIYCNRPDKITEVSSLFTGSSDHKLILATRTSKTVVSRPRIIKKRVYKNFNEDQFLNAIVNSNWWDVYSTDDLDSAVQLFTNKINNILNVMAPSKRIQIRSKYAPFMSAATKDLIKYRDSSFQQASFTGKNEDWDRYRMIRNRVTNSLRKEKLDWQRSKMSNIVNDNSTIWKNMKSFLGWCSGGAPSKLIFEGKVYNKPADLANVMNQFFVSKTRNLIGKIPDSVYDPLEKLRNIFRHNQAKFYLKCVHPDEVLSVIAKLKSTKSCGLDNIDSYIIKLARYELTPVITHIINLAITQGKFPTLWKCSKVVPLLKKREKTDPKNYRPVSLLSVTSKIMERVVFDQMILFLESNSILHPCHHGFRAKHSTCTALLQMQDSWLDALERNEITAVVMCDMSAAFDIVNHKLLLQKLALFGFQSNVLNWLTSYLSNRKQRVIIDGYLSNPLDLEAGVPQGSILGPLLYICFSNDMPEVIHEHNYVSSDDSNSNPPFNVGCKDCGSICCFADDSTFSKSSSDCRLLKEGIDLKYKIIMDYMHSNKLVINTDKTHLVILATRRDHCRNGNFDITLNTGSEVISPENCGKMLGCLMSSDFSWNAYLRDDEHSLYRQVITRINVLSKISKYSSFKTRKMIANGIIMSKFTYLIQLWGGCSKYLIVSLQSLQNRAARIVTGMDWSTSVKTLLLQCGWMSLNQLTVYHSLVLVYQIKTERKPEYFSEKLNKTFSKQTRLATGGGIRTLQKFRYNATQSGFLVRGSVFWNLLPPGIRQCKSMVSFKSSVRSWVTKNVGINP